MTKRQIKFLQGFTTITGTAIGAGIFGMPYVFWQAGPIVGVMWTIFLGFVITITNLLHGEFSLRTSDDRMFVGISRVYLSKFWSNLAGFTSVTSLFGALLAYVILGGIFLSYLAPNINFSVDAHTVTYTLIVFALLFTGIKALERAELYLTVILVVFVLIFIGYLTTTIESINIFSPGSVSKFLLPYGVILFALNSTSSIPATEEVIGKDKDLLKPIIISSGVFVTVMSALFGLLISGTSGDLTSQDALDGLNGLVNNKVIILGYVIGFFAILTSHIVASYTMNTVLVRDYYFNKALALAITILGPLVVFFTMNPKFIEVIGFFGAVSGGIIGILIGVISIKSHEAKTRAPEYCVKHDYAWAWVTMCVYGVGLILYILDKF